VSVGAFVMNVIEPPGIVKLPLVVSLTILAEELSALYSLTTEARETFVLTVSVLSAVNGLTII